MLLTAADVEGGALQVDVDEGGLNVDALPQAALDTWRVLINPATGSAQRDAITASDALGAMRVALYLGKGVSQCAHALNRVAAGPTYGAGTDDAVARLLLDARDPQAAHVRHEMFMHRPDFEGCCLGSGTMRRLCARYGVQETSILERLARASGFLRIRTPIEDGGSVIAHALAHDGFHTVDILFEPPFNNVIELLDALTENARAGVRSVTVHARGRVERDRSPRKGTMTSIEADVALASALTACSKLPGLRRLSVTADPPCDLRARSIWVLETLTAMSALTELCIYGLPNNFHHPRLRLLGLLAPEARDVDLPELRSLRLDHVPGGCVHNSILPGGAMFQQLTHLRALSVDIRADRNVVYPDTFCSLQRLQTLKITLKQSDWCAESTLTGNEAAAVLAALRPLTRLEALSVSADGRVVDEAECGLLSTVATVAHTLARLRMLRLPTPASLKRDGPAALPTQAAEGLQSLAARVDVALVREHLAHNKTREGWAFVSVPEGIRVIEASDELASLFAADYDMHE